MRTTKPIRVLIFTKYTLLREGIKALLTQADLIEIAGEAVTMAEAMGLLRRLDPDVILMDPIALDLSGANVTRRLKAASPHAGVLLLSMDADEYMISSCMRAGASGHISSTDRPIQLKNAIAACAEKGRRAA
jgi:DNA-binding NarL/FixJ family response regulator